MSSRSSQRSSRATLPATSATEAGLRVRRPDRGRQPAPVPPQIVTRAVARVGDRRVPLDHGVQLARGEFGDHRAVVVGREEPDQVEGAHRAGGQLGHDAVQRRLRAVVGRWHERRVRPAGGQEGLRDQVGEIALGAGAGDPALRAGAHDPRRGSVERLDRRRRRLRPARRHPDHAANAGARGRREHVDDQDGGREHVRLTRRRAGERARPGAEVVAADDQVDGAGPRPHERVEALGAGRDRFPGGPPGDAVV